MESRTDGHNAAIVTFRSCFVIAPVKVRLPATIFQDSYTLLSYLELSLSSLHCLAMDLTKIYEINFPVTLNAKQSSECITKHFPPEWIDLYAH